MHHLHPDVEMHFIGTVDGFERPLVEKSKVNFASLNEVQSGPIHGVNPLRALNSLRKLTIGMWQAFRLLRRIKPQAILSTGGWVSLPVALAARVQRVPMLIYLPDIEPGLTIKTLRLFAKKVAITVPESAQFFREGQTVVTGYPLRSEMKDATREVALSHFNLDPARKTVLVFGGSRGSRAINIVIGDILPDLLENGIQVIHITGTLDWERSQKQVGEWAAHDQYHARAYLHDDMALAFAAADLAVCRSGASILGEFPFFRLPSVLIPLAYSWRYQQVNADYMAERGAAVHLPEEQAADDLLATILTLISDDSRLQSMQGHVASLTKPNGAENLAQALVEMARGHS